MRILKKKSELSLGTLLITGGSRGIGFEIAQQALTFSKQVILCARTESELKKAQTVLDPSKKKVSVFSRNLDSFSAGEVFGSEVSEKVDCLDTLVLNAGLAQDLAFSESTSESTLQEFGVNYFASLGLTKSLLKSLLKSSRPRIILVSSLTAIVPFPGNVNYSASKAALNTWARGLALEMSETPLEVYFLLPGLTDTKMVQGKKTVLPAMDPRFVAESLIKGLQKNQKVIVPGLMNQAAHWWSKLSPGSFDFVISALSDTVVPGWEKNKTS